MGWVEGYAGPVGSQLRLVSYAPATGEPLGDVPVLVEGEVRDAVGRARAAQLEWGTTPVEIRCRRVLDFRDALVDHADEVVDLLSKESGKPRLEALSHELMIAADVAEYYASEAPRLLAPRQLDLHLLKHRLSYVHYVPRGVVAIIAPWNFPLMIPISDALAAWIAGNAVVLKPSEITPLIAMLAKKIFDESGMPPDLFQVVTGLGQTGAALIDAQPDRVVFTGSVATGRRIAAACGERLIPCVLELGGKAPAIVCEDADLERTARALVFGSFANSGQVCVSVERVYAHHGIYEPLLARVTELTRELRVGDPLFDEIDLGAMMYPPQIEVVEKLVADAVSKGAEVRVGGRRGEGQRFEPTVLAHCTHAMDVMRAEIFGPVVAFMAVGNDEEALQLANDSPLGLAGYVFTKDRERGRRLGASVEAGMVMVNAALSGYGIPEAPFGGVKNSGIGRVRGEEGLRAMCEERHVNLDRSLTMGRDPLSLFWFPYKARTYRASMRFLKGFFRTGSLLRRLLRFF